VSDRREGGQSSDARERLAAIGEIAAEIAHELRNVLQIVSASAYLARMDPAGSAPHIAKIERHARVAHGIVDDLMALARGEAATATPIPVVEVIAAARADLEGERVDWQDAIMPEALCVRAHPGLLTRVMHVLFENAIHVSAPNRPAIATRARQEGGRVVIDVQDDGPGVAPDLAPRIFEPLVTGRAGGSGLGLALAKRIVAAHEGTIALVPSERGACFRVTLDA
jgi:two-component system C4-dicarboxylate transport sensor histidine kinase DctB